MFLRVNLKLDQLSQKFIFKLWLITQTVFAVILICLMISILFWNEVPMKNLTYVVHAYHVVVELKAHHVYIEAQSTYWTS